MKKIYSLLLIICLGIGALSAQDKQYYTFGWQMTQPLGAFSDFANQFSLRGGYFDGKIFMTDNLSVGFGIAYDGYNEEKPRDTYYFNNSTGAITAAIYNYVVEVPFTVGGYYHFASSNSNIQPYAGLGIGLNYITEHTVLQDLDIYNDQWAFLVKPEVGVYIPFNAESPFGFNIKVAYNFNTNKFSTAARDYNYMQSLNIGVGITYMIR